MDLRHKLIAIATLFGLSLTVNVTFCVWCIQQYYQPLVTVFGESPSIVHDSAGAGGFRVLASSPDGAGAAVFAGHTVVYTLFANAIVGLILLLVILRLSSRWFLRPVVWFREAAEQLGAGNWSFRVNLPTRDEFGVLGRQIDAMASTIARMEEESAAFEQREVGREAARYVMHNMRGPLTSVRWLAEANLMEVEAGSRFEGVERGILEAVDQALDGLQRHRHILDASPSVANRVCVQSLIDEVLENVRTTLPGGSPVIETEVDPEGMCVAVNRHHFKALLERLICHAAEVAGTSQSVRVEVRPAEEDTAHWELKIAPIAFGRTGSGKGEVRGPSRDSDSGVACLQLVRKVVDMHMGRYEVVDGDDGSEILMLTIPWLKEEARPDG